MGFEHLAGIDRPAGQLGIAATAAGTAARQVGAAAKGTAGAGHQQDPRRAFVADAVDGVDHFGDHADVQGVHPFGTVDGQRGDAIGFFEKDVFIGHGKGFPYQLTGLA